MSLYSRIEPIQNVLAGDPDVAALFDALEAKGIVSIGGSFRLEDGSTFLEHWSSFSLNGRRTAISLEREIAGTVSALGDAIERGLAMSLAEVWEEGWEVVANVGVDVEERCIRVAEVRQLVYRHDSDIPDLPGIVL